MKLLEQLTQRGLVIATRNRGKRAEFERLLQPYGIEVTSLDDWDIEGEAVEDAPDFAGNAKKKASFAYEALRRPVLADDSGLVVDALGGEPGVKSARYGGPGLDDAGRRRLLLQNLAGVEREKRSARFLCVLALCTGEGEYHFFEGASEGFITESEEGSGGFGYDPIFRSETGRSFGEMDAGQKDAVSHRGRAIRLLLAHLSAG